MSDIRLFRLAAGVAVELSGLHCCDRKAPSEFDRSADADLPRGASALEEGFSRNVRNIDPWRTGDLELCLSTPADMERSRFLIERSYTEN